MINNSNSEYIAKKSIYDVMQKLDKWDYSLLMAISHMPKEDVIPVEWIEKWMNERCGYKHATCKSLLADWDKENKKKF